jgi:hypothetical protein
MILLVSVSWVAGIIDRATGTWHNISYNRSFTTSGSAVLTKAVIVRKRRLHAKCSNFYLDLLCGANQNVLFSRGQPWKCLMTISIAPPSSKPTRQFLTGSLTEICRNSLLCLPSPTHAQAPCHW